MTRELARFWLSVEHFLGVSDDWFQQKLRFIWNSPECM
jgi:hypothetical protein